MRGLCATLEQNVLMLAETNAACDVLGDAKTLAKFFIGKFKTRTEALLDSF